MRNRERFLLWAFITGLCVSNALTARNFNLRVTLLEQSQDCERREIARRHYMEVVYWKPLIWQTTGIKPSLSPMEYGEAHDESVKQYFPDGWEEQDRQRRYSALFNWSRGR